MYSNSACSAPRNCKLSMAYDGQLHRRTLNQSCTFRFGIRRLSPGFTDAGTKLLASMRFPAPVEPLVQHAVAAASASGTTSCRATEPAALAAAATTSFDAGTSGHPLGMPSRSQHPQQAPWHGMARVPSAMPSPTALHAAQGASPQPSYLLQCQQLLPGLAFKSPLGRLPSVAGRLPPPPASHPQPPTPQQQQLAPGVRRGASQMCMTSKQPCACSPDTFRTFKRHALPDCGIYRHPCGRRAPSRCTPELQPYLQPAACRFRACRPQPGKHLAYRQQCRPG